MPENATPGGDVTSRPSPRRAEPDAHGQAALLLAESILHALVEVNTFTVAQAIGVVRIAYEVKIDVAAETNESEGRMLHSLSLLSAIENSLATDGDGSGETD